MLLENGPSELVGMNKLQILVILSRATIRTIWPKMKIAVLLMYPQKVTKYLKIIILNPSKRNFGFELCKVRYAYITYQ